MHLDVTARFAGQRIHPDVSLIATTLNEAANIHDFLRRISGQRVLPAEIVIVDGGSIDGTLAALQGWEPPSGVRYVVSSLPGANISRGRNAAIELASCDWIAITDAGAYAESDWLQQLSRHFDGEVDVVSGFFGPASSTFLPTTIASIITPTPLEIDSESFLPSSRSVAIRRETVLAAGGYPEWLDYCEDLVLDLSLKRSGAQFYFEPAAMVTWPGRPTWRSYFKQYYRYARGDGKAGLWTKRHVARYAAYAIGVSGVVATAVTRSPIPLALVALGAASYLAKFATRALYHSGAFGHPAARTLLVPAVVIAGDVAKMIGYPVGLVWRWKAPLGPARQ